MPEDPRRFYTYAYLRGEDSPRGRKNSPYYIGKGSYKRAWQSSGRPVAKPTDPNRIVMLRTGLTEKEAFSWETFYILHYGRLDIGTGCLHNKSDGGEGNSGMVIPESARKVHSMNRKREKKWQGENNPKFGGDAVRGELNPMWGRKHSAESRAKMSATRKKNNQDPARQITMKLSKLRYLYELIDPDGNVYITENLYEFSKQYGLTNANINKVVNGKCRHHKGWTGRIVERLR